MRIPDASACAVALLFMLPAASGAQAPYPSQQIRIICAFPAGGGTDLTARLLGEQMQKLLGQPVVVDNRTGASGMIGTEAAARAKPDGYTLLVASGEMALNPHLYPKMAYDWDRDIQPVSLLVKVPNVMAVNMDIPAKSVAELIAYAKQNPGKLTFSSSGVGNPQQLTGELFNKMAGVQIRHVPYKGAAPQLAAVAGKEVSLTYVSIGAAKPFIDGQRIRPIGVTSLTRVAALPDVPAIAEHPALAGFELVNFFGFFGPAGLPDPVLRRLNATATQVMRMPELVTKFRSLGFEPSPNTPEQFREFIRSESAKFGKIIVEAGVKLEP
ncbi:MAG TPA: tripartite tricarboxylate transporter substrate binding protein [Burkholderiales bacterium]|nr:tripartite tricarboxylate transporter substrate binding protein [Burkholderiales bacterium]